MKSFCKVALISGAVACALLSQSVFASTGNNAKPVAGQTQSASQQVDQKQKESYALGSSFGSYINEMFSSSDVDVDKSSIVSGFEDALADKSKLTKEEIGQAMESFQNRMMEAQKAKHEAEAAASVKEGDAFRETFAKQAGVKKTESGLLYKIEKKGKEAHPTANDKVEVVYTGKLVNGKEFDNSTWRKDATVLSLNSVIPGWSEGLQLIGEGGKITLVVPPELGYGDNSIPGNEQSSGIPAKSTLVFDVELVKIEK